MFFSFKKDRIQYKVIKLVKIVNIYQAKEFDFKGCSICFLDYLTKNLNKPLTHFEINYGQKQWRSETGFKRAIDKIDNSKVYSFMASAKDDSSEIMVGNPILNLYKYPKYGIISIELSINGDCYDHKSLIHFINQNYKMLEFDYGYLVNLNESYDFGTERKIRRKLFGYEVSVEEIDSMWRSHSVGVNYGYLKRLYPINFLNQSHLSQPVIYRLAEQKVGDFTKLNHKITIWSLNQHDLDLATQQLRDSQYLIADEKSYRFFLNTEDANTFYEQMKL